MAGLLKPPGQVPAIDAVAAELHRWASEPFDWTRDNCGLAVLAYVERVRGVRLWPRPRFVGQVGAGLMLERRGGFHAYCRWAFDKLGCPPTDAPIRGDAALAVFPAGLTACLVLGDAGDGRMYLGARGDRAAVIEPLVPVATWSVPCPRP